VPLVQNLIISLSIWFTYQNFFFEGGEGGEEESLDEIDEKIPNC
jgi:hypothetical protein